MAGLPDGVQPEATFSDMDATRGMEADHPAKEKEGIRETLTRSGNPASSPDSHPDDSHHCSHDLNDCVYSRDWASFDFKLNRRQYCKSYPKSYHVHSLRGAH
jgi:hypothetical protein